MVREKNVLLQISDVPVKICQPSTRAGYSEMCSIKGPTGLQQPHGWGAGRRPWLQLDCS